jgi:hypothetical protein
MVADVGRAGTITQPPFCDRSNSGIPGSASLTARLVGVTVGVGVGVHRSGVAGLASVVGRLGVGVGVALRPTAAAGTILSPDLTAGNVAV